MKGEAVKGERKHNGERCARVVYVHVHVRTIPFIRTFNKATSRIRQHGAGENSGMLFVHIDCPGEVSLSISSGKYKE